MHAEWPSRRCSGRRLCQPWIPRNGAATVSEREPGAARPRFFTVSAQLAARTVEVFNAQQETASILVGEALVQEGGIGMSKVQRPIWRRGETEDG